MRVGVYAAFESFAGPEATIFGLTRLESATAALLLGSVTVLVHNLHRNWVTTPVTTGDANALSPDFLPPAADGAAWLAVCPRRDHPSHRDDGVRHPDDDRPSE